MSGDRTRHWSTSPFATRLIDDHGTRITLTRRGFKTEAAGAVERINVAPEEWNNLLAEHFGIDEAFTPDDLDR